MRPMAAVHKPRETRWAEEATHFDGVAQRVADTALPIDSLAIQRYTRPVLRKRFSYEFRFRLLGNLRGKTILDIGCGDGLNTVLFAKMGARVTGVDLSSKAVEVASRRARINGVSDRVTLVCAPVEMADLADDAFDVVWGDGVLHHMLDELELVMSRLARWAKPGGILIFSEPVTLFEPLRHLRRMIPVHTSATPGERPLVRAEIELVRRHIRDLTIRYYTCLWRLNRVVLINCNYERSPVARRIIANGLDLAHHALLSLPLLQNLAGTCVMYGNPNKASCAR